MFSITSNSKEFMRDLHRIPKAMQQVTAATLTQTAQAVTKRSERNLGRTMIVRTPFTTRSLRTYKASPGRPIDRQDSVSGTISDYLPVQDEGGKIKAKGRKIPIPTNRLRGADRKKKVSPKYRMNRSGDIQFTRPYKKGAKFFALYPTTADMDDEKNWGERRGKKKTKYKVNPDKIFGRKRGDRTVGYRLSRPAIFTREGKRLLKVRDIGEATVKVRARKWHREAVETYGNYKQMARFFQINAAKFLHVRVSRS